MRQVKVKLFSQQNSKYIAVFKFESKAIFKHTHTHTHTHIYNRRWFMRGFTIFYTVGVVQSMK
jgi:hypothetical protein